MRTGRPCSRGRTHTALIVDVGTKNSHEESLGAVTKQSVWCNILTTQWKGLDSSKRQPHVVVAIKSNTKLLRIKPNVDWDATAEFTTVRQWNVVIVSIHHIIEISIACQTCQDRVAANEEHSTHGNEWS